MFRRSVIVALCLLAAGWLSVQPIRASDGVLFKTQITFSAPFALPGMGLGAGTYVFERPLEGVANMVRVRSVDGRRVYLTALTDRVARPAGLDPGVMLSFGEAPLGQPQPIATWWPPEADHGYSFRYNAR